MPSRGSGSKRSTAGTSLGVPADEPATDGWAPIAGLEPRRERLDIADIGVLSEVTHPMRGVILRRLKEPRTVAEIATQLDVPVTRLYHHVNRLERVGLIRVVATRQVAAVTERRYQVVAESFGVSDELLAADDPHHLAAALGALFDVAKVSLQREVEGGNFADAVASDDHAVLSLAELDLSPARHRELIARLTGVISEFRSDVEPDDDDSRRITLFIAAFPETT